MNPPSDSGGGVPQSPTVSTAGVAKPTTSWFVVEIQQMMHGFGDVRKPLVESATVIEEIVHQQMVQLLYQAGEVASARNARFLGIEDFLFLLRKDKVKLRRLLKYLELKDMKSTPFRTPTMEEDENTETAEGKAPPKKRKKLCFDYLCAIDQTGELVSLFEDDGRNDEIKLDRALRAELLTRQMDRKQYMEYCEARQVGFTPKYKTQKFKDWLMAGVTLDIKPNPFAMEVLAYMAYETVAQIVDLALLVKRDMAMTVDSPFGQAMPSVCVSHEGTTTPSRVPNIPPPPLKSPTASCPSSPVTSPPSTPTTPTNAGGLGAGLCRDLNSSGGSTSSKSKSKKKKKVPGPSVRELTTTQAISPNDIREAMRRYSQLLGPIGGFSKRPVFPIKQRLLCC